MIKTRISQYGKFLFIAGLLFLLGCSDENSSDQFANGLEDVLEEMVQEYDLKGTSVTAISSKGSVTKATAGVSIEGSPINSDHIFGAGSITKTFFATIIMQLVEEGSLSLEDDIEQILGSEFTIPDSIVSKSITVEQLLNHTSGIYDFNTNPDIVSTVLNDPLKLWGPLDIFFFVQSPYFEPGTGWQYSSTNYIILGMMIEKVTGNKAIDELKNRILTPLNLENTYLPPGDQLGSNVANPWSLRLNPSGPLVNIINIPNEGLNSIAWTTGGIYATSEDIARFARALFIGDLVSASSLTLMTQFIDNGSGGHFQGYGLGVMYSQGLLEYWGHGGSIPGYESRMAYFPENGIILVMMANRDLIQNTDEIMNRMIEVLID